MYHSKKQNSEDISQNRPCKNVSPGPAVAFNVYVRSELVHKNVSLLFFEQLHKKLVNFNSFWHAISKKLDAND